MVRYVVLDWKYTPLKKVPLSRGVYAVYREGEVVYIGSSGILSERIRGNHVVKYYVHRKEEIYCLFYEVEDYRMMEKKLISIFKPKFNVNLRKLDLEADEIDKLKDLWNFNKAIPA